MSLAPLLRRAALSLALLSTAQASRADGEFTQLDVSQSTTGGVASVQRGALTFGGVVTIPDGDPSAVLSASWGLALPAGATLRIGPAVGLSGPRLSEAEAGARLVIERYAGTAWGGVYGLVDLSTVDRAGFVLGQVSLSAAKLTLEVSHGASDEYVETTVAASRRIGDSPVSLRAGYRFDAGEAFVGISVNTF